jgi:shikimate dehydrogenase
MRKYGLIGYPLSHSFSAQYFTDMFEKEGIEGCVYKNYPIEIIEELPGLILSEGLSGFNVTIPYKEAVIEYLHEIDETADAIGAVNCVKMSDGKLRGHNTDVYGFTESLKKLIGTQKPEALILGTGGSSKAVAYALSQMGIAFKFVSRRKKAEWYTYTELNETIIGSHHLIINTTPMGMYPNVGEEPHIPYEALTPQHYLFDLLYNPAETEFLKKGGKLGAKTVNGLEMLHFQAEKNWEIWNQY